MACSAPKILNPFHLVFLPANRTAAIPFAIRLVPSQKRHHNAFFKALTYTTLSRKPSSSSFIQTFNHSSSAAVKQPSSDNAVKHPSSDKRLIHLIESEIQCVEEIHNPDPRGWHRVGFPFELQDNPGQQTISLSREYQDEVIKVDVHMPDFDDDEDLADDEDDEDDDDEDVFYRPEIIEFSISLVVHVYKKSGQYLELNCTAYDDEIVIDSLLVKDPKSIENQIPYEPDFSKLDEKLQEGFHKYLEVRGIKLETTNFLRDYMLYRHRKEFIAWLKNVKKFVEA